MDKHLAEVIGAIIRALIILGGLFAVARNLGIFFIGGLRGHAGQRWYNRPYLFRALAWTFTLFWLFGPYYTPNNIFQLTESQTRITSFALFMLAAAAWLWVERISFLDGIPQQILPKKPAWARWLGWEGHATLTYLIQLVCAAAIGLLFISVTSKSIALAWLAVLPFLIGTAGMAFWRFTCMVGPDHTFGEVMQHVLGGRDAGQPHHHEPEPAPVAAQDDQPTAQS
jgi:hypothetical protein